MSTEKCRNCNKELIGSHQTGVYHPETKERCPQNFYGGYVCSEPCDRQACIDLERSMPGNFPFKSLSSVAERQIKKNWPEKYNY